MLIIVATVSVAIIAALLRRAVKRLQKPYVSLEDRLRQR